MNDYIRKCLYRFTIANLTTQIRIREAIIKTLTEIGELNDCGMINDAIINTLTEIGELLDCGVISCEEYIYLGKDIGMIS